MFGIPHDKWERRQWPFVRWLGLGKLVWRKLQVSYDLPKPSSAPPRHALSCAASRDDCTMLRNTQVQSADLGATFVVVRCRGRALNEAATRSGGASPYRVVRCRGRLPSAEIICSMISGGVSSP